jgi:xanthine dehydrogenase molybdopterin-binding subunit B
MYAFNLGEAKYIDDIPVRVDELHGAFVMSTVANCLLDEVDASIALVIKILIQVIEQLFYSSFSIYRKRME